MSVPARGESFRPYSNPLAVLRALALALLMLAAGAAGAQVTPGPIPAERLGEPAAPRQDLPQLDTPQRQPELSVPAPAESGTPGQPNVTLAVREIRLTGNRTLPAARLREIAGEYEGRTITDVELQQLRVRLTRLYADAGYATSRAVIPDQDVNDGVITIQIIEGRLAGVELQGEHHFDPEFLKQRIAWGASVPLNVNQLQEHLRWLLTDPLLADLDAQLRPGPGTDETILHATVAEGDRFAAALTFANDRSPTVGGERVSLEGRARNLTGRGDQFGLMIGGTEGLIDLHANLGMPLNAAGTELFLRYADYDAEIIEEPLAAFDIETDFRTLEIELSHPFYRSPVRSLNVDLGFARRQSESYLDGVPFPFSSGSEQGRTDISVVRAGITLLERGWLGTISGRLTVSVGLDVLGATQHDDGRPDSQFLALLAQLQWLRLVGPAGGQLYGRFEMQQASDPLLPLEKFVLGGSYSVRGFRRARLVRDNGWSGTLEYRLPLLRLPVPFISASENDGQVSAMVFVDVGRAWNDRNPEGALNQLYGAGPGVRWDLGSGARAEVYWGAFRKDVARAGDDLQDHGVHFLVNMRRSF